MPNASSAMPTVVGPQLASAYALPSSWERYGANTCEMSMRRVGRVGQRQLARRGRAPDVQVERVHPAGHRLAGTAVARVAHLDAPAAHPFEPFDAQPARQRVQRATGALRGLVQIGLLLDAQPAGAEQGVDVVGQRDRRRRQRGGLIVLACALRPPPAARCQWPRGSTARQEDVETGLDQVRVAELVGRDDSVEIHAVAFGHVGEPIAWPNRVQHPVLGRDRQLLADQQQVGIIQVVRPQHRLGSQVIVVGDLPQHLVRRDRVRDRGRALGRLGRRLGDARERRELWLGFRRRRRGRGVRLGIRWRAEHQTGLAGGRLQVGTSTPCGPGSSR